jgi:2-succinyl-5-enolpyruvyl-6-hydroxy-3-cyclohexene-1-carboxylate synthase
MSDSDREELAPDCILSLGGQVVSKKLRLYLQAREGIRQLDAGADPLVTLQVLAEKLRQSPGKASYSVQYKALENQAMERVKMRVKDLPFGNLRVVASILDSLPGGSTLHLGNSGTIRYAQLMPFRDDISYYSNRGTSGIDGCISSAVGAAMVDEGLHVLVLGDLSFVYDSNALWNKDFPQNLKIIVLNDGGGGIFRLLDGPSQMAFFEEFSVTRHPVSLELLAQAYGRDIRRAGTLEEFEMALNSLFQAESHLQIIEADTSGSKNSRIFKNFLSQGNSTI